MIDPHSLLDIAQKFGTPCFVYDFADIRERIASLRAAFGNRFATSYAVKCNPNATLLQHLRGQVDSLDISSAGELRRALDAHWPAAALSFTGPGKTDAELQAAVEWEIGEMIVESVDESRRLSEIAARLQKSQRILVRINPASLPPGFGVGMAGKPTQFGIDEEAAGDALREIAALPHLSLRGLHIYAGTQCLRADAIAQAYRSFIDLFRRLCESIDLQPEKLIFGSGLGIRYYEADQSVDLAAISASVNPALDELRSKPCFGGTKFILETGRYLIGEAGVYLTRVVAAKHSRGAEFRICDGGMNHHLGAAGHLGTLIQRNYRMRNLTADAVAPTTPRPTTPVHLCGPLCTSIDMLARNIALPEVRIGDILAIECSGAYGPTASPTQFISHDPPKEIIAHLDDASSPVEA